jgi:hypothetical protein
MLVNLWKWSETSNICRLPSVLLVSQADGRNLWVGRQAQTPHCTCTHTTKTHENHPI